MEIRRESDRVRVLPIRSVRPAKRRVLSVDDDPAITRLLARFLERRGYVVLTETDPLSALERLRAAPGTVDALITDQTMPGMRGLELAYRAKSLSPRIEVFLATALDDEITLEELAESGVSHLIAKPFDLGGVADALEDALRGRRSIRST
jgi:CheY-like chemotaxis protein